MLAEVEVYCECCGVSVWVPGEIPCTAPGTLLRAFAECPVCGAELCNEFRLPPPKDTQGGGE